MATTDPIVPQVRRLSARVARLRWIIAATISLAIVAVVGLAGVRIRRHHEARRAIYLLGGYVGEDAKFAEKVPLIPGFSVDIGLLTSKVSTYVNVAAVKDSGDAALAHCPGLMNLEHLNCTDNAGVTDTGLEHLRTISSIKRLGLGYCAVTDNGLAVVSGMRDLETLSVSGTSVTGSCLKHVSRCARLWHLDLAKTSVGDAGLENLTSLLALSDLELSGTLVSDAGLVHLSSLNHLHTLRLENTRITDAGLVQLKGLHNLRNLMVGGTSVTPAGIQDLKKSLPELDVWDGLVRVSK